MQNQSRRQFLTKAIPITIGTTIGLSGVNTLATPINPSVEKKLKMIVIGAHPDDPETIGGGTMALYSQLGHNVVSVYLTRGEAGIEGMSHHEAAKIRTAEALEACEILKVKSEFIGQIDGNCEVTQERYSPLLNLLNDECPDIIITHWPIDSHRDHRICSMLVYDAWLNQGRQSALYYGEAMSGIQTQNFSPTDYVDITSVIELKHQACFAHVSQELAKSYADHHGKMEQFRGMEFGCDYAEAFVRQARSHTIYLK